MMRQRIYLVVTATLLLVIVGKAMPSLIQAKKTNQSCSGYGGALQPREVATLAYKASFRCGDLVAAIAIAGVESEGYNPKMKCENLRSDGTIRNTDWGLWQIDDDPRYFGGQCPPACALDPVRAANQTYALFHEQNHNDWRYWPASYNSIAYQARIPEAQAAAARYNQGCPGCPKGICQPTPTPFSTD